MALVKVLNMNGDPQWVPEHWITHPVLGKDFTPITATVVEKTANNKKGARNA